MNFLIKKLKKIKTGWLIGLILLLALFLRFYHLTQSPPSLYWEEVALGYDAYSLLRTGRDHRGNSWPIVYLESFMDYKPPLYVYVLIPSIKLLGLNDFSVRFPSAFLGVLTVLLLYFLTKELFRNLKFKIGNWKLEIGLIASFLLAISPWHLQFSRPAFEANLALFLVVLGILLFLRSFKKSFLLIFSALCFSLSLYAYHGARICSLLIVLILGIVYFKKIFKLNKLILITALFTGLLLSFPLIKSLGSGQVNQRFQETSVFATLEPVLESNRKIEEDGGGLIARFIHHRFWEYSRLFLNQYFKHFSLSYLFLSGDINNRHSTHEFGNLYHWEILSLIIGLVFVLKNIRKKEFLLLFCWLLIGPVPGAITKAAPHSLRTIFVLPVFIIISSLGVIQLIKVLKNKKLLIPALRRGPRAGICLAGAVSLLLFAEFILYLHFYHYHYPRLYSQDWQYGYKQAVEFIKDNEDKYESVYLTNEYGRAYMYYLFYSQMEPQRAQELIESYKKTADIPQLGKVSFILQPGELKRLTIGTDGQIESGRLLKTINNLDGKVVLEIREQ